MKQPVIFISQEVLSDSLSNGGDAETFSDSIGELIEGGFQVAIGPESAPTKVFTISDNFYDWFSDLQDISDDDLDDDADSDSGSDDPELEAIEHITMMEERGWPTDDDTLSPKEMDQAEIRAGLRDPD